jgi:hypothetical protein
MDRKILVADNLSTKAEDIPTKPDNLRPPGVQANLPPMTTPLPLAAPLPVIPSEAALRSMTPEQKTRTIADLTHTFGELLPVLSSILEHMKEQNIHDVQITDKLKRTNRWLMLLSVFGFGSLVLCGMIALRMHVTVQRLETTEVKLIQLGKSLAQNLEVSSESRQLVTEIRKYELTKPTVVLTQDEKKPEKVRVTIIPPREPEKKPAGAAPANGSKQEKPLELPIRLPQNVSVGDK